jgi:protein-S-isoprenylcysteine O-methyltransferase Ste14
MQDDDSQGTPWRPLPPSYFFVSLVAGILLHWVLPISRFIPWPYRILGCLPLGIGGWIMLWTDQIFKQRGTTVKPHEQPSALITTGPFAFSRHPMYVGMTLILIGIAVLLGSITAFIAPIIFAYAMQLKFIPVEEKSMMDVFGDDYAAYKRKVRRWI